ncbi:MAG: hypothetical protein KF850_37215 [Labilithrix sp.]|nr:hypothetical protein [Labilithrix sp.]
MSKSRVVVVFAFAAAAVLAAGCKKKAGGSCKGTESTCIDKQTALACQGGTFVEIACAGPLGCAKYKDHASCDTSVASAGDPCLGEEDDEYACSPDKQRAVICKHGKFEPWLECRGKAGCSMLGRSVSCDTSIAEQGDPCKTQGAVACSGDQKHMVVCRDGKFALYRYCRGQHGCFSRGETPSCDLTQSLAGDPCGIPGQVVCSVDGKTELVCQGGVFTKSITCKTSCTVTNRPGRPIDCR